MLQKISINNYAIIDELEISFSGDMNVITGETGAGKSIIMGALSLILGQRADTSVLVNKEKKCVIEAVFKTGDKRSIRSFLEENELDVSKEVLIRREIAANGKSRAFINDTPVNLSQLQQLTAMLVDLHQQFDTLEVGNTDFQREVLDALAGHAEVLEEYRESFLQWKRKAKELEQLENQKLEFEKEADYNRFQYEELESAGFVENELEEAEASLKLMENSEGIKEVLSRSYYELQESETPVSLQLKTLISQLNQYASFHTELPGLVERMQSAQIELQDIAGELDRISSQVEHDPQKMEELNDRLSLGYKLQKKHGVSSTAELLRIQQGLEEKLQAVLNIDQAIQQKEKESKELFEKVSDTAKKISASRKKQVKPFEEKVNQLLAQVGMPNARIKVEMNQAEPGVNGTDEIIFLFNANIPAGRSAKEENFLPVYKVASGGELSRLMLCVKSLVAKSIDLPTMIFDEIDTGISGEAARQVGIIMKELSLNRQVICITHQPQIAGKAVAHYFVYKEIENNAVQTRVRLLNKDERVTAIAKMLSGEKPTASALENAREMLMN